MMSMYLPQAWTIHVSVQDSLIVPVYLVSTPSFQGYDRSGYGGDLAGLGYADSSYGGGGGSGGSGGGGGGEEIFLHQSSTGKKRITNTKSGGAGYYFLLLCLKLFRALYGWVLGLVWYRCSVGRVEKLIIRVLKKCFFMRLIFGSWKLDQNLNCWAIFGLAHICPHFGHFLWYPD